MELPSSSHTGWPAPYRRGRPAAYLLLPLTAAPAGEVMQAILLLLTRCAACAH